MKTTDESNVKYYDYSAGACCILFGLLFLFLANHENLWYDEIFALQQSRLDWKGIVSLAERDFHPAGYYFLLNVFCRIFGWGIFAARILSVLLMTLSGILIYQTGKILSSPEKGFAAMLFFYFLPGSQFMHWKSGCMRQLFFLCLPILCLRQCSSGSGEY